MDRPAIIHNIDGTENRKGRIQYYCWLKVYIDGKAKGMRFFLTGLGNDRFILGYPFLCEFNPQIDWSSGSLTKGHVVISTLGREKPWEPREFRIKKLTTTQEWARNQHITKGERTPKIVPECYNKFAQVFDEKLAKQFPPK